MPVVRPAELLPAGGPVTLAFLTCPRCVWEINQAQLDKPPWSGSTHRYRCPGCGGRVEWQIHGPAWRPVDALLREGATKLVARRKMKVADAPVLIGLRAPLTMAGNLYVAEDSCPKKI
jgi:hypothetical protein